jgi:kumamolisin
MYASEAGIPTIRLRALLAACALAASAAAVPAAAAGASDLAPVPGSELRGLARAQAVGAVAPSTRLTVAVTFAPRNATLLAELAARSSGRPPLAGWQVADLFLPTRADVAALRSYLAARGLSFRSQAGLSVVFAGNAGAAERAFGVDLRSYRGRDGRAFRAPAGPIRLPEQLAARVAAVDGLDTAQVVRPAGGALDPHVSPGPPCGGAASEQARNGGYLPSDLAAPEGYDYQSLLDGGYDGSGEEIAFVEFSDYRRTDVSTFRSCFGLTGTQIVDRPVNGGTTDRSGAAEVALDLEVALAAAPDLEKAYLYTAPNPTGFATVLNAITDDARSGVTGVHLVSISWGLCEPYITLGASAATNAALQIAAVQGISVFAAAGDSGAADCGPDVPRAFVDEPAGQPYATAVGGTTLDTSGGTHAERVWNNGASGGGAGGGGISINWPMPSWQQAVGVLPGVSSGEPCVVPAGYCRQVPDVALNADELDSGYVIYCFANACGNSGWLVAGGTSAAAPLFAAMSADANEYSLAHGGARLGFANRFLYDAFVADRAVFFDVKTGDNGLFGVPGFSAGDGYDVPSGLGSLDAARMASDLAAYSAAAPSIHASQLAASPTAARTLVWGKSLTFAGRLVDTATGAPIGGRPVWIEFRDGIRVFGGAAVTDSSGRWSRTFSTAIKRRSSWRAYYLGEEGHAPAKTARRLVYVVPRLASYTNLPRLSGEAVVTAGNRFTVSGRARPRMRGATVSLQVRTSRHGRWRASGVTARVGRRGAFAGRVAFARTGRHWLRWHYAGGRTRPWLSASSPPRVVDVVGYRIVGFSS